MLKLVLLAVLGLHIVRADPIRARAVVFAASQDFNQPLRVVGILDFTQTGGNVQINGTLTGLAPGAHGFHIHEKGDLGNACVAAGGHFNPTNKQHGAPTDINRHVGDLGNVNTLSNGQTPININDHVISLSGPFSIIGRAVVVHERADDLGRGNTEASKTTGDAGARVACGIIGTV